MISCMEEKMFDAQDDAHLSDVLSYPVHLHVIHVARRRLASKREWKITRIEQKKKKHYRRQAPRSFFWRNMSHFALMFMQHRITTVTLFAKFLLTGKNKFI